jgi:hypothetical protein
VVALVLAVVVVGAVVVVVTWLALDGVEPHADNVTAPTHAVTSAPTLSLLKVDSSPLFRWKETSLNWDDEVMLLISL